MKNRFFFHHLCSTYYSYIQQCFSFRKFASCFRLLIYRWCGWFLFYFSFFCISSLHRLIFFHLLDTLSCLASLQFPYNTISCLYMHNKHCPYAVLFCFLFFTFFYSVNRIFSMAFAFVVIVMLSTQSRISFCRSQSNEYYPLCVVYAASGKKKQTFTITKKIKIHTKWYGK